MIQRLVGFCLMLGLSIASPLFKKGAFAPAPPGERPPCASKSMTFCEEVDKYPTKLIQSLLQAKPIDMYDFFTDESEGLDEPPEYVLHQEMTLKPTEETKSRKVRSANETLESDDLYKLCPVQTKMATPKIASNSKGEWRFIAQDELSKMQQKFKVHLCNENAVCQKFCTQFYAPFPMISVEPNGEMVENIFWMPSTCRCFDTSENML